MKLHTLISVSLLAALAALSSLAQAEDKAAPAAETKAEKAAAPTTRPHSHVQDKTGIPQDAKPADPAKMNAAQDKTKHYHPRDMK